MCECWAGLIVNNPETPPEVLSLGGALWCELDTARRKVLVREEG